MAQRDRAAVGVHFFRRQSRLSNYGERLRGECFVQLDHGDVLQFQSRELQGFRDCIHGTDAEFFR
jgi:hypothetical protein